MQVRKPRLARPFSCVALIGPSLLFLLLSCAGISSPPPEVQTTVDVATPPFYQIEGNAGGTILLMGTVHLGPPGGWQFSPAILEGLARADRFILELDMRALDEGAIGALVAELVVIQPPNTLLDLVSPTTARLLDEKDVALSQMGMPREMRRRFKPWFIVVSLLESMSVQSGFDSASAAENTILEASGKRPLTGLESVVEQLGFFDDLSPRLQDALLQETLVGLDTAGEELNALVEAWRRGDEAGLEALGRDGVDDFPELEEFYEILLGDRNRKWLAVFKTFLEDPKLSDETLFVGVGALHLFGDDGLIELFDEAGYVAKSIDQSARDR